MMNYISHISVEHTIDGLSSPNLYLIYTGAISMIRQGWIIDSNWNNISVNWPTFIQIKGD